MRFMILILFVCVTQQSKQNLISTVKVSLALDRTLKNE